MDNIFKKVITANVSKNVEQEELCYSLLVGTENGTVTLEDGVALSYKANIVWPYDIASVLFDVYPNGMETGPHENLNTNIYRSFRNNCPKLEETKTFLKNGDQINKLWYIPTMKY